MFSKFVKRYCSKIALHCNHTIVRLINCLRIDSFYKLLVESKPTNLTPVCSFSCEIDFIILSSDLMFFNHLIRFAMDYENTSSDCCSCDTMFKLNDKRSNVNLLFIGTFTVNWIDQYLDISDLVRWVFLRKIEIVRFFWYVFREFKNSLRFIEWRISVYTLPGV